MKEDENSNSNIGPMIAGSSRMSMPPASPSMSRASSMERDGSVGPGSDRRVLRIKRFVRFIVVCIQILCADYFCFLFPQIDGEWQTEIVRDPSVIRAYVRKRQMIEEESVPAGELMPTGDEERDRRARKVLEEKIARMKKNQERRLHRKNAKISKEGGTLMQLDRPVKADTTVRSHCRLMSS